MLASTSSLNRRKLILIVDDESDSSEMLAHVLAPLYDVDIAYDGVDGLEHAARNPPDLVISDVSMPRLSGLEMVRHLRHRQGLKAPVIFMSALGEPKDIIAGIAAGARHYLQKPVSLDEVKKRVARALGD